jgi:transglutaminase-like putative cysteine protease
MTETQPKSARATRRLALPSGRTWVDIAVLTVLSLIGLLGFAVSFSSGLYLVAGVGGIVVGTAVGVVAASLRLGPLTTAVAAVAAYFVFGSPLAMPAFATLGFLPSASTLSGLAVGAVFGWSDIVTLNTPVIAPDYIGVLPYVATWMVGLVTSTVATRWFTTHRRTPLSSFLALLAPSALYVASVLTGTGSPVLAPLRGVAFAVIALVWMAWRVPESANATIGSTTGLLRRKLTGAGMIVVVAVVGGTLVGAVTAPNDRFVLRDKITPPFELENYASPLAGFRAYTKSTSTDPLFTVTGLTQGDRIQIATMDNYNGQVWNVTSPAPGSQESGTFGLASGKLAQPSTGRSGAHETLRIVVDKYRDYWIPTSGHATSVNFTAQAPGSTEVRFNPETGILIDTAQVHAGQKYTLTTDRYVAPTPATLEKTAISSMVPTPTDLPAVIGAAAAKFAGAATTPYGKLHNIELKLQKGVLSHGQSGEPDSIAGHSLQRLTALLKDGRQMVGDQEQFAAVFALMARTLNYPSRVVMGFAPSLKVGSTISVVPKDITAWTEVQFAGVGWVRFDPTPTRTDAPTVTPTKPKTESLPLVRQPPRTGTTQNDLVSPTEVGKTKKDPEPFVLPAWVVPTALSVGIPLAAYFFPILMVAGVKRRRRKRRRTNGPAALRAAGAWDELADAYAELGYTVSRTSTRVQSALLFEEQFRDQLETRERERADAARQRTDRSARAVARSEATANASEIADRSASALLGGVMSRLKDASTWRPGVAGQNDALPVLPGLREFAVASDAAVFSGTEVSDETVDGLWSKLADAEAAARRSASWFRRRISSFRVRSRVDLSAAVFSRVAAARPAQLTRKAATR